MNFSMLLENPGFYIFGWKVHWYGVIMAAAMVAGIILAVIICKKKGYDKNMPYDVALAAIPSAVVGARLYYIAFYGVESFADVFAIWNGGLAIYGGVIGGYIGIVILCKIKKYDLLKVCDMAAPCLILGQAIGRWGNFINQEAYGYAVTNPSLQFFPYAVFIDGAGWHMATFFYEFVCSVVILIALLFMTKYVKQKGLIVSVYSIFYGIARVIIEGYRTDSLMLGDLRISQAVSIVMIAIGIARITAIIISEYKKRKVLQPAAESIAKPVVIVKSPPSETKNIPATKKQEDKK